MNGEDEYGEMVDLPGVIHNDALFEHQPASNIVTTETNPPQNELVEEKIPGQFLLCPSILQENILKMRG